MSNLTDLISGGGGDAAPLPYKQFVIGQSKTWTAPATGKIKVIITGGGGQGAFVANQNRFAQSNYGSGTGGGGGGYSEKVFEVTAGETFTVTIGAGGFSSTGVNSINSTRVGNNAGNSSFVTASAAVSVNLIANGGGGGQMVSGGNNNAHVVAGGTGGTASGGDFNFTGGAGGSVTRAAGSQYSAAVTGGGSVALYGTSYTGGNITIDHGGAVPSNRFLATGGAGVGGSAGAVNSVGSDRLALLSGGGSATKDSTVLSSVVGAQTTIAGTATSGGPTGSPTISVIDAQGEGGFARFAYNSTAYSADGSFGGGGGGSSAWNFANSTSSYAYAGNGGGFGGGGACSFVSQENYAATGEIRAGYGGVGGGGSGAYNGPFSTMTSASGRVWASGGDGLCIVMFI